LPHPGFGVEGATPALFTSLTTRLLSTDFAFWPQAIAIALSLLCRESTVPLSLITPSVVVTLI
jgi:hypothetical protein